MHLLDIIARKRDGEELSRQEIKFIVSGYLNGSVPDYQVSAFLMAAYIRGMNRNETIALTEEMLHSGRTIDLGANRPRAVDKHSTGGVGDKTSLILAPVVSSAGVLVPMISGRGLGHSGGTLDKLESIPGFRTGLSLSEFHKMIESTGAAMIGQTAEIAPADRKLYALRDVTATVSSIPLMVASIMSKKLAEGIDGLVLDVKVGSGAFLKEQEHAEALGKMMIEIAAAAGKRAVALLTDMSQPLGRMVGNSLEVVEALETLRGDGPKDLTILCRELAAEMLVLGDAASSLDEGREIYDRKINSGQALEKFREIVTGQGGSAGVVDNPELLPQGRYEMQVRASSSGTIASIDTETIGRASVILGAGRARLDSEIDHAVGLSFEVKIADTVREGDALAVIHYNNASRAEEAAALISESIHISSEALSAPKLILSRLA